MQDPLAAPVRMTAAAAFGGQQQGANIYAMPGVQASTSSAAAAQQEGTGASYTDPARGEQADSLRYATTCCIAIFVSGTHSVQCQCSTVYWGLCTNCCDVQSLVGSSVSMAFIGWLVVSDNTGDGVLHRSPLEELRQMWADEGMGQLGKVPASKVRALCICATLHTIIHLY